MRVWCMAPSSVQSRILFTFPRLVKSFLPELPCVRCGFSVCCVEGVFTSHDEKDCLHRRETLQVCIPSGTHYTVQSASLSLSHHTNTRADAKHLSLHNLSYQLRH